MNTLQNLNASQLEILKLFSRDLDEKDLKEIKRMIVKFLSKKITKLSDEVWENKSWTNDDMEKMLISEERTPYKNKK